MPSAAIQNIRFDYWQCGLSEVISECLAKQAGSAKPEFQPSLLAKLIERPKESKFGDFSFPCFRYAKILGKKPQDIAGFLAQELTSSKFVGIEKCEVVGAFVNIYISKVVMASLLLPQILNGEYFNLKNQVLALGISQEKVMIEFSQPNTHKEFHVGHMRNVALGDALVRVFRYCGHEVVAANYPGDEGAHVAKCLWFIRSQKLTPPNENQGQWLGEVYTKAVQFLAAANTDDKTKYDKEVSDTLRAIEAKSGPVFELWQKTRQWSLELFYKIYNWLDIKFDCYFFESELSDSSQQIVDKYLKTGVFIVSDGAIGVDLNSYDLGFLLLRKRDGNTLYATKDLALAARKFEQFGVERSIYIVAAEQNLHFRQVFKTLELMGFKQAGKCFHLSYGLVLLPEGKMSSRAGTSVTLDFLREEIERELDTVLERYKLEWSAEELKDVRSKLTIGALKYGMLATDPVKDVVFNIKNWISFEGDSGPYLMYSYARSKSILRKAAEGGIGIASAAGYQFDSSYEGDLIRWIYDFNETILATCHQYKPSLLTHYLFDLCQAFNRFYGNLSVLKAENKHQAESRLALVAVFSAVLEQGLSLLGIRPPQRM